MKICDWLVERLIEEGITDAFGIPGAVMLDFLYAMDRRRPAFTPHLNYHEQGAAFSACGYAQATGGLCLAYATRGPGFTNMLTAIADAYYDSLPVLFFTAHAAGLKKPGMRIEDNQEMDTVALAAGITKYAARVDRAEDVRPQLEKALAAAREGRKGPVVLDFRSSVFRQESGEEQETAPVPVPADPGPVKRIAEDIAQRVRAAARPVFLIGNGIRQAEAAAMMSRLAIHAGIPVLSSRVAQDVMPDSPYYYGFIGSHAARCGNFILSKADLIVGLGNRFSFPVRSPSFRPVMTNAATVRVDVDEGEFLREVPNSVCHGADLRALLPALLQMDFSRLGKEHWLAVCGELREALRQWDMTPEIDLLMRIMRRAEPEDVFLCDVGNHSFWVTNAYAYAGMRNRILYSGSLGTLGSALPKAIGACFKGRRRVFCFTGDQGLQMNIQELQLISQEALPVVIVVLNNRSSGMIRDREAQLHAGHFVHTTPDSGYGMPDLRDISRAYRIEYRRAETLDTGELPDFKDGPCLLEVLVDEDAGLRPSLPYGNYCQDMAPSLPKEFYERLNSLR